MKSPGSLKDRAMIRLWTHRFAHLLASFRR